MVNSLWGYTWHMRRVNCHFHLNRMILIWVIRQLLFGKFCECWNRDKVRIKKHNYHSLQRQSEDNVPSLSQNCPRDIEIEIETELELEKEKDKVSVTVSEETVCRAKNARRVMEVMVSQEINRVKSGTEKWCSRCAEQTRLRVPREFHIVSEIPAVSTCFNRCFFPDLW